MTDLRKAAEMALEALEWNYGTDLENIENCMAWLEKMNATIPALRQALAQPEQGNSSPNYPITESNTSLDKIVEQAIQGHASTRDAIRWAMQQEREACAKLCEGYDVFGPGTRERFADAIRARSEKPWVKTYCGGKPNYCTPEVTPDVDAVNMTQERVDETAKRKHEPVVWVVQYKDRHEFVWGSKPEFRGGTVLAFQPLYMAPPKREWVGLTGLEQKELMAMNSRYAVFETEAKLKERNHGLL